MDPLLKEIRHNPMLWLLALVPVALVSANLASINSGLSATVQRSVPSPRRHQHERRERTG
jgi:hypothetical protein